MTKHADKVGIEFISVLGMPPVEFVNLTADLGCRQVGMGLAPLPPIVLGYPDWSLRTDAALRRETQAAMRDRGVTISVGEGFFISPSADAGSFAADLDLMCELGAAQVNALSFDPDLARTFDQLATFAEMAGARGLGALVEFVPTLPIGDLETALAAIRHAGTPNFRAMIDMMHVFRSGLTVADLAALDPNSVGYVQICDVPLVSKFATYGQEAAHERLAPGAGELPQLDALAALPRDRSVGLEVPMLARAQAGEGAQQRLKPCVEATRALLSRLGR